MPYEKSIAREHRIYGITFTGDFDRVWDQLTRPEDRAEIEEFVCTQKKISVDGFIMSYGGGMEIKTSIDNPEVLTVDVEEQFCVPVSNWHEKTWVKSIGTGVIRIFFS